MPLLSANDLTGMLSGCDAEAVTVNGTALSAIFDDSFLQQNLQTGQVEATTPRITCKTSDVSGAAHGQTVVARSTTYYIVGIQPDGAGLTTLFLSTNAEV